MIGNAMDLLLQRPVFIVLALIGAAMAVAGSIALGKRDSAESRPARWLLRAGYALTGISMLLFIIIGFRGE